MSLIQEYQLITTEEAQRMKDILLNEQLSKPIEIDLGETMFRASYLSDSYDSKYLEMKRIDFMNNNPNDVLYAYGRDYAFFYLVGDWGYKYRIPGVHVCLGTSKYHDFFAQMDLSQSLQDEYNLYFVKNISKLAGEGAISRLNNGLGNDRRKKLFRREKLVKFLNAKVINYDDQSWMSFASIPVKSFNDKNFRSNILYEFLSGFIKYALSVEFIISEVMDV